MKTLLWSAGIALCTAALSVANAEADTVKCQRTIAKASSQFVQAKVKALSKCEESIVKGKITGPCPDAKTAASISKAADKLTASIGKSCGGDDQVCGGNLTNEPTPVSLGWPSTCPDFENGHVCIGIPIDNCSGISACLACIDEAAVDQAINLYYDDLQLPSTGDLNKCQAAIGKAGAAFLTSKTKALQKCWDAKLNGKLQPAATCVDPNPGDGKYLAAIAKAEAKKAATICKACGGADKVCGGATDLTPAQIGFPATCPAVTIPGGSPCSGAVTDLTSLVACVDCVTEFKADCVDRLQVPEYTPYPPECDVCTLPAATGPCPTTMEFTAEGQRVDLDSGWTGLAHNANIPTNGRITLTVSGCDNPNQPTCGQCNVNGPIENTGGPAFNNHRCQDKPWVQCSNDGDCITGGATGPCIFFFGPPLPLVAGGVSTCILNEISGPVTGTINIDDGTSTTNVPLSSKVHPSGTEFGPCPQCNAGLCTDGPRVGQACSITGESIQYGNVSLDCPPNPGSNAGTLGINLNIATGTQNTTLSTANPKCRQTGYTGLRCFCDTCNEINQTACTSNADCPISGGNPGICGGKRCIGGTNAGAPCSNISACPGGGQCNVPGEATQPSACLDDTSTPEVGCQSIGDNQGQCPDGPVDQNCSIQTQHACSIDSDCDPSGSCPQCLAGQTCVAKNRACFTDNGVVGNTVSVQGNPDPPCGGVSKPTVGTFFCVAPVGASAVNAAGGLPGLGRIRIPGTVVVTP